MQGTQQTNIMYVSSKTSPASDIILEEHLKKCVQRTSVQPFSTRSKEQPRMKHSVFGDFPKDKMPKKGSDPEPEPLDVHAKSIAITGNNILKKGEGKGGQTFSKNKPKSMFRAPKPRAGAFKRRVIPISEFRRYYERGDLPIIIEHAGSGNRIAWKVDIADLDLHHYLPVFFEGLREKQDPYRFLAVQGTFDILEKGAGKVLSVIPQLIIPIKTALNTRDPDIISITMKVLQKLVTCADSIGEALVPYYRQILPIFNLYKMKNRNTGDFIDYS